MKLKRRKKLKVETVPPDSFQVITFSLVNETNKKKEYYAVPIEQVREIRNYTEITTVPKAKKYVRGVMNLRGLIIPVVDIKKRLGFGEIDELNKTKYKIIIADVRDSIYGLLVDNVENVIHISPKDIEPIPSDSFESHHYLKGIVKIQGLLVVLLDIIALFEDPQENSNEIIKPQIDIQTTNDSSDKKLNEYDDVPEALKDVFREDAEINSSLEESIK
jgi:purine-binding chemotaxis protein CheW